MQQVPGRRADLELVPLALAEAGNEQLPHTRRQQMPHHVHAAVPSVEVAHHRDALRVGRPDGKVHAADAAQIGRVRAQTVLHLQQLPFAEQVQVVVGGDAAEPIGVVELDRLAPLEVDEQPVVEAVLERRDAGDVRLEQAVGVPPGHRDGRAPRGAGAARSMARAPGLSTRILKAPDGPSRWGPRNRKGSPCCPRTSASRSGLSDMGGS